MEDSLTYNPTTSETIVFGILLINCIVVILQIVKWSGSNIKKFIYLIAVPTTSIMIYIILEELSVMIVIHYSPHFILLVSIFIHLLLRNKVQNWIEKIAD